MNNPWTKKDLMSLYDLSAEEITLILDTAQEFKKVSQRKIKKVPALRGKTVVNLFIEPSTRTRISFELKGETLLDTVRNIEALQADLVVIRHSAAGAPNFLASRVRCGIVNAGDGAHSHPTQALLDLFTMREKKGSIKGLNVSIIGDILHSRVARSDMWGLLKLGANVTFSGPSTLVPREFEAAGVRVCDNLEDALVGADVVNLLRIQHERQRSGFFPSTGEYARVFGLNKESLKYIKPDALIMHPGPINRDVELASALADGPQSVILEQVTNGLAVRMAVLFLVAGCLK